MKTCWWALVLGGVAACGVNLPIDPDANISCRDDDDCPDDFQCDARVQLCVSTTRNTPPTVEGQFAARHPITSAEIEVVVRDANLGDALALAVRARREGGDWQAITLSTAPTITNGAPATLVWDIAADAANASGLVDPIPVDLDGDGTAETTRPGLSWIELEIVASDSRSGQSAPLVLGPVPIGHSPVDLSWNALADEFSEQVPLEVYLADPAADTVAVQAEFQLDASAVWRRAHIVFGNPETMPTADSPVAGILVWNSADDVNGDPTVPQGAGRSFSDNFSFRLRSVERDGAQVLYGSWVVQSGLTLVNASAPRIEGLHALRADTAAGQSPMAVTFRLSDRESDLVDLSFDYSFDGGQTWFGATEYPSIFSEGRYALTSLPGHLGGMPHVWYWDTTQITALGSDLTQLRVRARDGFSPDETAATVTVARPVGPALGTLSAAPAQTVCSYRIVGTDSCSISPQSIVSADFNRDGYPDVAVSNGGGRVGVHLSQSPPPAALTYGSTVYVVHSPRTLVAEDVNGDTYVDLLTVQENIHVDGTASGEDVAILLGSSNGVFSVGPKLESGTGAGSQTRAKDLVVGDFNGDTVQDLAVVNSNPAGVGVRLGTGGGSFAAPQQIAISGSVTRLQAADFDGDGREELAVGSGKDVLIHSLDQAGAWALAATVSLVGAGTSGLAIADLNQDGEIDIIGVSSFKLAVLLGQGDYTYVESLPHPVGEGATHVAVGDLNRDGFADLLASAPTGDTVDVFFGQGRAGVPLGAFVHALVVQIDQNPRAAVSIVSPIDNVMRFFTASQDPQLFTVSVPSHATGSFAAPSNITLSDSPEQLLVGDLDLDGGVDLMAVAFSESVDIYANPTDQDLGIGLATGRAATAPFELGTQAQLGDFDGDGWLDVVTEDTSASGTWGIFWGPLAEAAPSFTTLDLSYPLDVVVRDVTADGHLDVIATTGGDTARVYVNQGSTEARADKLVRVDLTLPAPSGSTTPYRIAPGDFDGDGDVDLMFGYGSCSFLRVDSLAKQGGGFSSATVVPCSTPAGESVQAVSAGDVNGDGHVDLVFGVYGSLALACGNGAGGFTFASRVVYSPFARDVFGDTATPIDSTNGIQIVDLNNDGLRDVLMTVETYGETITLFRRPTSGACELGSYVLGLDDHSSYKMYGAVADLNRDGALDVLAGHSDTRSVRMWLGQYFGTGRPWTERIGGAHTFVGADLDLVGTDLFAEPYDRRELAAHPEVVNADGRPADFVVELRETASITLPDGTTATHPSGLRAIAGPTQMSGDQRFRHVADTSGVCPGTPHRIEVTPFFGPSVASPSSPLEREGLSLGVNDRGVAVRLRVFPSVVTSGLPAAATYRVFQRVTEWRRAAQWSLDPLAGEPDAARFLPRQLEASGCRTVYDPTFTFREIPRDDDGSFATGSMRGPRFVVQDAGASVVVLTERLGTFMVFAP